MSLKLSVSDAPICNITLESSIMIQGASFDDSKMFIVQATVNSTSGACIIKLFMDVINSITWKTGVFVKASRK
jgi:hypothetical protein